MELAWSLLGTLLGALGGAWLSVAWSHKTMVKPLKESRDRWRTLAEDTAAAWSRDNDAKRQGFEKLNELWRECFAEQVRWAGKFERADKERRQVRDRLAAALWSNRQLKRETGDLYAQLNREWRDAVESDGCACRSLDDQVEWRIRNIEAQLQTQEGEL